MTVVVVLKALRLHHKQRGCGVVTKKESHMPPPPPCRYDLGTPAIITFFLLQTDPDPHQRREKLCGPHRKSLGTPAINVHCKLFFRLYLFGRVGTILKI